MKHPRTSRGLTGRHTFRGRAHVLDGGSVDPEKNVALFNVVKKARADGVPKANIESALQKVHVWRTGSRRGVAVLFSRETLTRLVC
jgi:hypothetical protein